MASAGTELWGWERFFGELDSFLESVERHLGTANEQFAQYVLERMQVCLRSVGAVRRELTVIHSSQSSTLAGSRLTPQDESIVSGYAISLGELLQCLEQVAQEWEAYLDTLQSGVQSNAYSAPQLYAAGRRGRPRFEVTRDQLEYLASLSFTWTQIAAMLGVSRMTVYRRRQEFGILGNATTTLTDGGLQVVLREMRVEMPELGETLVLGRLRAMGYRVTRERVRHSIRITDPLNTPLRWRGGLTSRRPYSVPGPNSLWHIDGHHKLVRWRFVTHGGIDGYSRLIVYLKCTTNNRAATVHNQFLEAVRQYGLPSRVRCDQGRENQLVALHMIRARGAERRSIIAGSSVHNQRIERLWRDLHRSVTQLYYRLFYYLEHRNLLDPLNEHHLFALHYVYKDRINRAIQHFKEGWNSHGIRTEHNQTPHQLFTAGALRLRNSGLSALDFFEEVGDDYGNEDDGLTSQNDQAGVNIPANRYRLSDDHYATLQQRVNPLADSDNYGIELYEQTLEFLHEVV